MRSNRDPEDESETYTLDTDDTFSYGKNDEPPGEDYADYDED